MANYTAADVKKLREETDAPMMECKAALDEADGDFERAKIILKEKGKAATAKRADRATGAGVVAFSVSHDHKRLGAVVLESETDFVARNEDFIALANELAEIYLHNDPGADPTAIKHGERTVQEMIEEAVGKIRENIRISTALHLTTDAIYATYQHHDKAQGAIVELTGEGDQVPNVGRDLAIQVVALKPEVVAKEDLSQEKIKQEVDIQTKRAMDEGKPEEMARKIAEGRVNKEYVKEAVLLEQSFFKDNAISVGTHLKQALPTGSVKSFRYLKVGG